MAGRQHQHLKTITDADQSSVGDKSPKDQLDSSTDSVSHQEKRMDDASQSDDPGGCASIALLRSETKRSAP
jgi:hypothetical protein